MYRTYEELKLATPVVFDLAAFSCLYRTYEELKPNSESVANEHEISSLYRTYEELKQEKMKPSDVVVLVVCIVPMRN